MPVYNPNLPPGCFEDDPRAPWNAPDTPNPIRRVCVSCGAEVKRWEHDDAQDAHQCAACFAAGAPDRGHATRCSDCGEFVEEWASLEAEAAGVCKDCARPLPEDDPREWR